MFVSNSLKSALKHFTSLSTPNGGSMGSLMKNELFRCYFCNMADNDAKFPGKSESAPGLNYTGNGVSLFKTL